MPGFVEPQFCRAVTRPPSGKTWVHEIKLDGYRMQMRVEDGAARLRTRTGLDWTDRFPAIAEAGRALPDAMLDGEIVALGPDGAPDFAALQAAIAAEKTDALVFFAFDLLFHDGADLRKQPLRTRKRTLQGLLGGAGTLRYVEHFDEEGPAVLASAKTLGLEGVVSKRADAIYRSGRSDSWTKAKIRVGHEVVLGAWTQTDGAFRSLLGGVFRDGALVYVGRIGTGYNAKTVAALMPTLKAHAAAKSPFARKGAPPRDRAIRWLEPVLVAEIEFAGWSADGLVRQASFKGLREDKPATEVVAEVAVSPEASPMIPAATTAARPVSKAPAKTDTPAKAPAKKSSKVAVMGVALSHPDKALWPDADDGAPVTKRDLAGYFEAVGAWMLPHIEGRPCSIIRAPDGIDHQTFFQRHAMAGGSKLFDTVKILGDHEPYLVINHVEGLAAVAQSGGLELHPSNCAPGEPLVPGRLVFDLDPAPDVAFAEVVATAKALKARLAALGLESFCKTTGGKGLHVVTPLAPTKTIVGWDEAKDFAHRVCQAMERDEPGRYLTKMSKAARKGRIFLDYLRNDRIATAVAPLSPRARPHAPVSMPLTWSQVKTDLDPLKYTVRSVPKLLARGKAWAGYADAARPLADAIDALRKG
jgi:bifunctional non-homologous end joining protein LigD